MIGTASWALRVEGVRSYAANGQQLGFIFLQWAYPAAISRRGLRREYHRSGRRKLTTRGRCPTALVGRRPSARRRVQPRR
jgi:hypothetical protein